MLNRAIGQSAPSAASIASLIASVPALLWEADAELRVTFVCGNVAPAPTIRELFLSAVSARNIFEAHQRALCGDTATFDMELQGRCYHAIVKPSVGNASVGNASVGNEGRPRGVIGIALDMTDRMVSERAFRISEHSYRSLIEDAPYAICQATLSGELLQVNRAMAEMLGYGIDAASEVLLRDLPFVFRPAGAFETFSRAVRQQKSLAGTESAWVRRDGRVIRVWVSGRVVPGRGGEISHLEIFAEDITEKKRVEAEQGQAHKMQALGRLAGGVAHDFNNLLLVISGHVEMLLADAEADGEASAGSRDSLLAVQGAAMRAAALTEQMLAFSRARASRIETVDLNELLRKLMSILSRLIREDIEFRLETQDRPVFVRVDPHEIERVVVNLAVNAQDAMPCGGRLTIESCELPANESVSLESGRIEGGDYVRLSVQDTGIGMDREVQARVFEPFFTLRSDTGPQGQGTGLGLSVVYGIVRQHNGYIGIESEPGRGATFRVYLPRATAPSPAAAPGERAAAPKRLPGGSETILLAEDDSAIRRMLTPFLAGLGYRVLAAQDGVEALEVARGWSGEIHLLLTDVVMPGLGGPDLAVQLRAANRPGLRVLFISGYAGNAPGGAADPMAGTALLQKPFSMDRLAGAVREALTVTAA